MSAYERGTVLVAGAGIAGLTAALHLVRSGWECVVVESAPGPHPEGAGLHVAPNGARVLRRLGVDLAPGACKVDAIAVRRWDDNETLGLLSLTGTTDVPYYTMHRADLHAALLARLSAGVVRYGVALTGLDEDASSVRVLLSDGSSWTGDVLIGADGIHSAVRTLLCDDEPVYTENVMYRGIIPTGPATEGLSPDHATIWAGPGRHFVAYPISGGAAYYISASADGQPWEGVDWSEPADLNIVRQPYADWDGTVTALLSAAPRMTRWALFDRPLVTGWPGQRITLVGDAAHAMPPFLAQGANLAMEDAAVLVACLDDAAGDVVTALRRYETARAERVAAVHRLTASRGATFRLVDGADQEARDAALRAGSLGDDFGWIFGYDTDDALR
ncbi:salicylate hydroxylase [Actinokineospora alba]|uniref:Salicylate hydroxylase n=1 Tax=Actinokineospora alba TaxID=504798 RepID=A0A1H0L6P2_9PSEU|nr:FAD-dependent monooxygenase [Actinokineospora alba]TDP67220.1 salicylate hydroxylase [Actinokineospora alba]SDJ04008.1 salicylate hydroxylase [Actinokineospora alba]SDO63887.1 salicylate hydroxylase [Actinokineospora alba]